MAEILQNEQHKKWEAPRISLDFVNAEQQPSDLSSLKNVQIESVHENSDITPIAFDSNKFFFRNKEGRVIEYYSGADQYSREVCEGKAVQFTIGDKTYNLVTDNTDRNFTMGYETSRNLFTLGAAGLAEYRKSPEISLASFMHEDAHMKFFSLPQSQQKEIGDQLLNDPNLKPLLEKFAYALYSDKKPYGTSTAGEIYLNAHNMQNSSNKDRFSRDGQQGIKDNRSIVINVDGKQHEVSIAMLATELISYTSGLEVSPTVFKQIQETSREKRGEEDSRYQIAKAFHDQVKDRDFYKNLFSTDQNLIKHYLNLITTELS